MEMSDESLKLAWRYGPRAHDVGCRGFGADAAEGYRGEGVADAEAGIGRRHFQWSNREGRAKDRAQEQERVWRESHQGHRAKSTEGAGQEQRSNPAEGAGH